MRILFVCTGNSCRSPMAELYFEELCRKAGRDDIDVRSAGTCLDVLEATGAAARCRCVMHWFSGSSDELGRALRLGCSFSVGERMLATRRGREYARQLPAARLLLETDLPDGAGQGVGADGLLASLDRALTALAQARGVDKDELAAKLSANARALADGVCTLAV